jgi:proteasome-associated ATPase
MTSKFTNAVHFVSSPEEHIRALEAQVAEYRKAIEELNAQPSRFGIVIDPNAGGGRTVIRCDLGIIQVQVPSGLRLTRGDYLRLHHQSFAILEQTEPPLPAGTVGMVDEVIDDEWSMVIIGGDKRLVMNGPFTVARDDRVIVESGAQLIIRKLPPLQKADEWIDDPIEWSSIGGCETAKQALIDAVETPYKHPMVFARYRQKPIRGVLLYGPPGNGKSLLGKGLASSLAKKHGRASSTGFIYQKGPEVLSRFVGDSELGVRTLFTRAREHKAKNGYPAVIFVDEADAILGSRSNDFYNNSMSRTVVPQFLSEMDGLEESGAFVLLATNRPEMLDPAVVRDKRIDRRIHVPRPDKGTAAAVLDIHLAGKPCDDGVRDRVVDVFFDDDRFRLFEVSHKMGPATIITLAHAVSGASLAGVVDRMTERAIHREIATGKESRIELADVEVALGDMYREAFDVDHTEVIREVCGKREITGIRKLMAKGDR